MVQSQNTSQPQFHNDTEKKNHNDINGKRTNIKSVLNKKIVDDYDYPMQAPVKEKKIQTKLCHIMSSANKTSKIPARISRLFPTITPPFPFKTT